MEFFVGMVLRSSLKTGTAGIGYEYSLALQYRKKVDVNMLPSIQICLK
jgi:hypothetical protein